MSCREFSNAQAGYLGGSRGPAAATHSGCVRVKWVFPRARLKCAECGWYPGRDTGCAESGCFPGRDDCCAEDGYSSDEMNCNECMMDIIIVGISANSYEAFSMYARFSVRLLDYIA